jgi:hypothetical protein
MNAMSLDTRKAFRDLRASGADEPLADAIVDLFRQASDMPDVADLATKADVADLATRIDLADFATKTDLAQLEVKMAKQENRLIVWIAGAAAFSAFANGGFQFLGKLLRLG